MMSRITLAAAKLPVNFQSKADVFYSD